MTSWMFLPIFVASPTAGTKPTAAQNASPTRPPISASMPSRMSPTARIPDRIWPRMYSGVARDGSSASGQNSAEESPQTAPLTASPGLPLYLSGSSSSPSGFPSPSVSRVERIGVLVELLPVRHAVAVRVALAGVRAELGLLAVAQPVAVRVRDLRVGAGRELVGVGHAVAVGVGLRRVGSAPRLLAVVYPVAVGVGVLRVRSARPLVSVGHAVAVGVGPSGSVAARVVRCTRRPDRRRSCRRPGASRS